MRRILAALAVTAALAAPAQAKKPDQHKRPPRTTTTTTTTTVEPSTTTTAPPTTSSSTTTSTTTTTEPPTTSSTPSTTSSTTTTPPAPVSVALVDYSGGGMAPARFAAGLRQDQPFDGIVVNSNVGPFNCTPPADDATTRAQLVAGTAVRGRYTHNYLKVWTPSTVFSWSNPTCTDNLVAGLAALADTAVAAGFDGLMLDTETYGQINVWLTAPQVGPTAVRIGQALAARGIPLSMTWARSAYDGDRASWSAMPTFISGVQQGGAVVTDGNLVGYWYRPSQYAPATARLHSEQPGMLVAQPAAIDYAPDLAGAVREAIRNSDRFAWLYSEGVAGRYWWDGNMPASIVAAVRSGRAQAGSPP